MSAETILSVPRVIDVGVNLTNKAFKNHWRDVVKRSVEAGVDRIILTGTSMGTSEESLCMAETWQKETGVANLYCTVGVHPHDAKSWDGTTKQRMEELLQHPLAVSVGECGLDFNRNFSTKEQQLRAFRNQVELACKLHKPIFVHEREAHEDLLQILNGVAAEKQLPPVVVHCFTGAEREAVAYLERGFYLGFTGFICKKERGAEVREFLPKLRPYLLQHQIMVETDAPFMGFKKREASKGGKKRRGCPSSEPADCPDVARKIGEVMGISHDEACLATTTAAESFFRLAEQSEGRKPLRSPLAPCG